MRKRVCPKCGDRFPTSTYTCPNCGENLSNASIVEIDESISAPTHRCPKCGTRLKQGVRNCPSCGEFIARTVKSSYYDDSGSSGSSNAFLYIFSFLIPVVGIIAGAILLTNDDKYKKSSGKVALLLGVISVVVGAVITACFLL